MVFWCRHDPAEDPHLASQFPRHLVLPVVHVAVLVEDDLSLRAGRLLQVAVVGVALHDFPLVRKGAQDTVLVGTGLGRDKGIDLLR